MIGAGGTIGSVAAAIVVAFPTQSRMVTAAIDWTGARGSSSTPRNRPWSRSSMRSGRSVHSKVCGSSARLR